MDGTWNSATCNIGFNPKAWELMFDAVPSKAIGLEWEPAHQMVQLIDPLPVLEQWIDRVYHLHGKDCTIHWDRVKNVRRVRRRQLRRAPHSRLRRHRLAERIPHPVLQQL